MNSDYLIKLAIIGDQSVGKSNLVLTMVEGQSFQENYTATIGVDFKVKHLELGGKLIKCSIWDTAGQERFRSITPTSYRGVDGVILVYDVTDENSFQNVKKWMSDVDQYCQPEGV